MKENGRNDWLYQVAGHIGQARLSEALPVMATLHVLGSLSYLRESTAPYVLGWEVNGPDLECEVDIATILEYDGLPAVVIGEIKNWKESIDANDLTNLAKIQQHIRGKGIDCFVLVAVMRELRKDEIRVLREFAKRPPNVLPIRSAILPVLPIVLTERDLSAGRFGRDHPSQWAPADGVVGLAKESCRMNLGMTDLDFTVDGAGYYFQPIWSLTERQRVYNSFYAALLAYQQGQLEKIAADQPATK